VSITKRLPEGKVKKYRPNLWFERVMALIATLNLVLVLFDLSYIPLRDFWLHGIVKLGNFKAGWIELEGFRLKILPEPVSQFITRYDWVKGIVPDRDTQQYLERVDKLKRVLANNSINSPQVAVILKDLRDRSVDMVDTNPFALANKTGTLEQIKNRLREHLPNPDNSSRQAFVQFWSQEHLRDRAFQELQFFDGEIRPLMETNYYRPIDENGQFVDYFGLIDFPFGLIFGIEFLTRTWYISRKRTGVSWLDAMLWRWYDLFFLIPFWRWLRVIPVTIRLDRARLINLVPIQRQLSQGLVAGIAEDVTEVVVIRVINQIQLSIEQGDIGKLVSRRNVNSYVDINDINEVAEIAKIMAQLMVDRVLPQIAPEAKALLHYSLEKTFKESPLYQGIKFFPGVDRTFSHLSEQLVKQSYQTFSDALHAILKEDRQFNELLENLLTKSIQSLASEVTAQQSIAKIEGLLVELLEEIKINYVQRLSAEDIEEILEQKRSLRQVTQT
jgi:hypothetical protein